MKLKDFILRLRIRLKLLIAFGSLLLLSVILIITAISAINTIIHYKQVNEKVDLLANDFLKLNASAKNFVNEGFKQPVFLETGQSTNLSQYYDQFTSISHLLNDLDKDNLIADTKMASVRLSATNEINDYNDTFKHLVEKYRERGFKDHGVEGELRKAIHNVEDSDFAYDRVPMLMLRRHEKDFFLRKDLKYLDRFNSTIDEFISDIRSATAVPDQIVSNFEAQQIQILTSLENYKSQFNYIVKLEEEIGLNNESGLKGELYTSLSEITPQLNELGSLIKSDTRAEIQESIIILIALFLLQLIIGFVLVVFYSNVLTRAIKEIKSSMVKLSKGEFPDQVPVRTKDELGETKNALNNLVERIKVAADFATKLGNGELRTDYDQRYNDDVLAKAIILMQNKLRLAEDEQQKVNWANQGMALFNDILKDDSENVTILGDQIIRQLTNYIGANQGALFLLRGEDDEEAYLERIATYAYGKKKFVDQKLDLGESLVGQCVLEKESIYMTNIPNGYTRITSGLGGSTPSNLLIVPLKIRDKVMGVLEIASFRLFEDHERIFVEKLSESIANILSNKQIAEKTRSLLEESQQREEEMIAQEEMMRQNTEEIQATQEEMDRYKKQLEDQIVKLEEELESERKSNQKETSLDGMFQ
ncbi:MAG: GAF domain-containing protein [Bacteroidota bacterium]